MIYNKYIKRFLSFLISLIAIIILSPVFLILYFLVKSKLGSPVFYAQDRPGKNEEIFTMYKFRSMTNTCDKDGNLLPDDKRLTKFGKKMRSTSLDELPQLFNILKGDMSIVGPRPQAVRDYIFMNSKHKKRYDVRPGLTGLAQVNGRNSISWEKKLDYDVEYVDTESFLLDIKIIFSTVLIVLKKEGITSENHVTSLSYGKWLLNKKLITEEEYLEYYDNAQRMIQTTYKENQ